MVRFGRPFSRAVVKWGDQFIVASVMVGEIGPSIRGGVGTLQFCQSLCMIELYLLRILRAMQQGVMTTGRMGL